MILIKLSRFYSNPPSVPIVVWTRLHNRPTPWIEARHDKFSKEQLPFYGSLRSQFESLMVSDWHWYTGDSYNYNIPCIVVAGRAHKLSEDDWSKVWATDPGQRRWHELILKEGTCPLSLIHANSLGWTNKKVWPLSLIGSFSFKSLLF